MAEIILVQFIIMVLWLCGHERPHFLAFSERVLLCVIAIRDRAIAIQLTPRYPSIRQGRGQIFGLPSVI